VSPISFFFFSYFFFALYRSDYLGAISLEPPTFLFIHGFFINYE